MIKVLLADDHVLVRKGLRRLIAEAPDMIVTGEASTGQEALRLVLTESFDVAVVDLSMPGNGLEALKTIKRKNLKLAVLILSMHSEKAFAVETMREGASGYLTKDSAVEQLLQAIRTVAKGERYISPSVAEVLGESENSKRST